jgi:rRNA-processing protein FCF1
MLAILIKIVKVICDTSFLMVLVSKPTRQLDTIESDLGKLCFIVPDIVLDELKRIQALAGPKRSMIAKTAIEIAYSKFKLVKLTQSKSVDDAIFDYARTNKCAAATLDENLKKKLIQIEILVFTLSKNRIIVANHS